MSKRIELMEHQRVGGEWFLEQQNYRYLDSGGVGYFDLKGGISWLLGDAPRVGKTLTAIHTDAQLREYDDVEDEKAPTLILCPPQVMGVWKQALIDYYGWQVGLNIQVVDRPKRINWKIALEGMSELPVTFYICNYDTPPLEIDLMSNIKWFHIIVDECHNVKGRDTPKKPVKRSKALRQMKTRHKGATSGTPADNKPEDMWNILNWLWPKEWSSYWRFVDELFETWTNPNTGYKIIKRVNPDMLPIHYWPKLEGKYLRRTRADVAGGMPKVTYQEINIPMSSKMIKAYTEYEKENMTALDAVYGDEQIDLLSGYDVVVHSRLQQLAIGECEVVEEEEGKWDEEMEMWVPTQKLYLKEGKSPKFDAFCEFAKDDGNALVVFCQHNDTANKLYSQLTKSGISALRYMGEDGDARVFRSGEVQVIVGTYLMREGIDLAREDGGTVCFIDRASRTKWNEQAEARVQNINMPDMNINVIDFNTYIPNRAEPTIDQKRRERYTVKNEGIELLTNRPNT